MKRLPRLFRAKFFSRAALLGTAALIGAVCLAPRAIQTAATKRDLPI